MSSVKIKTILGLCFFMFFSLAEAQVELNKVVAIVNSSVITQIDLDKKMAQMQRHYRGTKKPVPSWSMLSKKSLNELIDVSLQLQMAKRGGIKVGDEEVNKIITSIAKSKS